MRLTRNIVSTLILILLLLAVLSSAQEPSRATVTILSTTDLHGNIYPIDYNTNKPGPRGLARVATIVRQVRKETPGLLLLDSGDTIQGTPLSFHHAKIYNRPPDAMMTVMNALSYDAMAVGNHEFEFGLDVLNKARGEAQFPWLSANTYKKGTDESYFKPFVIKQVNGIRVGILGLSTTGMPSLENADLTYSKIEVRDPLPEAKRWIALLRNQEQVDLVVIAMHMGLEADLQTGEMFPGQMPNENRAIAIAQQVPGVDVILMGHTHREIPSVLVNGVLLVQADKWGRSIARVDVYLEKATPSGTWKVATKSGRTIPVDVQTQPDPDVLRIAEPYHVETQDWLNQIIGECSEELKAGEERFRDTAILDLVHRVQLEAGNADVSTAMSLNPNARIPKGPVTIRDIIGLYEYEAAPVVVEVTGKILKEALEHSSRHFGPYSKNKRLLELIDERFPSYTYDVAEGVTYDLDISKPVGRRIQNMRFRGHTVSATQKLRLATNTFRVNGGAGYTMFKGAPVVHRSTKELRELIVDWVQRNRSIPTTATGNWRLLPETPR